VGGDRALGREPNALLAKLLPSEVEARGAKRKVGSVERRTPTVGQRLDVDRARAKRLNREEVRPFHAHGGSSVNRTAKRAIRGRPERVWGNYADPGVRRLSETGGPALKGAARRPNPSSDAPARARPAASGLEAA
jgi:hypothetical protein